MKRTEWKNLARPLDYNQRDAVKGELEAGKSNGATYLDIGGEAEAVVTEPRNSDEVTIHFRTEDLTRGELTLPKSIFE